MIEANFKLVLFLPAVNWMDVPKWRILENYIGNDDIIRIDKLNEIRPGELESPCLPHIPPSITLAINSPVLA